ncbi:L-cysteine desulfidase family protein [Vallitalea sp.]|jgi:L-cysteine desulfidase|uniref:L-cysteine desulfidase family protein n=1 Tax=Vallitalea sp. TaxID=1882829 RepID=UPI0025F5D910|nr:L-serine ammonia-lyase, iron-sulfur-dependent, subunit alpha [Vallitalea sp.]MCT4686980.1 L-serine ammonia-lyase, iron-sulfur-dependent, subunit alpha [Vallitalea sp.]
MCNVQSFIDLINKEVKPATGCTEPIAIALCVAKAKEVLDEDVEKIELLLSPNIIKNAMGVGIPGTSQVGIHIAAALGAIVGESKLGLEVLSKVKETHVNQANNIIDQNRIKIEVADKDCKLYIDATVIGKNNQAHVIIQGGHTDIVFISYNDDVIMDKLSEVVEVEDYKVAICIDSIYRFVQNTPFHEIKFILEGAIMNKKIALEGLNKEYGLKVGKTIEKNIKNNLIADDMKNYAIRLSAAASDARMAGCPLPVMTNSGSGNQGITATLPVVAIAEWLHKSEEELARALILSNLVAIHIKTNLGKLSALCGVIVAGIGAGCGMTYLLGGDIHNVKSTIKNMIGDVSGMICDGAKTGCALKVATVVEASFNSTILSLGNIEITKTEGIIDENIETCIKNLTCIGSKGMEETDKMILDIMISKNNK